MEAPLTYLYVNSGLYSNTFAMCQPSMSPTDLGSTGTGIGEGFSNTTSLAAMCTFGRVKQAVDYIGNGKLDWYLPSKDELTQLYLSRNVIQWERPSGYWWSSSLFDPRLAWYLDFTRGTWSYNSVTDDKYGRAVRAF
jgi:hypothetical protein